MKKVSADTITTLSAAAATVPGAGGTAPTTEEMIESIRADLTARAKALFTSIQHAREAAAEEKDKETAFHISHSRAAEYLAQFEEIVANVPNGFRLVPVLYSTIDHKQNARVYSQFTSRVRMEFMRYLAQNHAQELEELGICPKGIKRMAQGHKPADARGKPYEINIDHIIERYGGGTASLRQEVDPQMPSGSAPTYLTNHFSNLVLMPTAVHEVKNKLNDLQGASRTPHRQSKWILMLVPETSPGHAGYVAQPQKIPLTPASRADNPSAPNHTSALQDAFNAAKKLEPLVDESLRLGGLPTNKLAPALDAMSASLKNAFHTASMHHQGFRDFQKFYKGKKFMVLRDKIEELPPEETEKLCHTLEWLDGVIQKSFNGSATNDNSKRKAEHDAFPQSQNMPHKKKKHGKKHRKRHGRR